MKIRATIGIYQDFRQCTKCHKNTHVSRTNPCPSCGAKPLTDVVARWITLNYLGWYNWETSHTNVLVARGDELVVFAEDVVEVVVAGKIYRGKNVRYLVMSKPLADNCTDNLPNPIS